MQSGLEASSLLVQRITALAVEAGHVAIATWNGKTGTESKTGERHLYSDSYRARWPQEQYPEAYEEDVDVS